MRAAFATAIDRATEALDARRFRAAAALLSRAPAFSNVERRIRAHLLGLARMRMGEAASAFRVWEEAERRFGKHALLTCDIIDEHRVRGSFAASADRARALEIEMANARAHLSPATAARAYLTLSRVHEDEGAVAKARGCAALAAAASEAGSPLRISSEAQLLALDARYSPEAPTVSSDQAAQAARLCAERNFAWALAAAAAGETALATDLANALLGRRDATVEWKRKQWAELQCDLVHFGARECVEEMPTDLTPSAEDAAASFLRKLASLESEAPDSPESAAALSTAQRLSIWILQARLPGAAGANARANLDHALAKLDAADAAGWANRMKRRGAVSPPSARGAAKARSAFSDRTRSAGPRSASLRPRSPAKSRSRE